MVGPITAHWKKLQLRGEKHKVNDMKWLNMSRGVERKGEKRRGAQCIKGGAAADSVYSSLAKKWFSHLGWL